MATFPTLTPSTRSFTPGIHPHSEIRALTGLQFRVRTSSVIINQRLRLSFAALTEAQMLSIRTHYIGQQGRFLSFGIPSSLLSGMTTPADFTPTGYSWIYASAPQVVDVACGRYDVTVELMTIPPEGANINGAEFTIRTSFTAGAATASSLVAGAALSVTASIAGGAPGGDIDVTATGFDLTVTTALAAGAATVNASATGFDLTVTVSLAAGESPETDPNFSSVSLLLHMDGSNNSTTFTDDSNNVLAVTAVGNAKISTAQSKFGGASGIFDGTGDYLSVNNSAVALAGGDFTIEGWVRLIALPTTKWGFAYNGSLTSNEHRIQFDINPTGIVYLFLQAGSGTSGAIASTATISVGSWSHIACTKSGNNIYIFVNGVLDASGTYTTAITPANTFYVGVTRSGGTTWSLNGYIDDLRITKGVARYTASFTPPTTPFPDL
ncbi:MAG: LamG domain-containing protein [Cyanobacteriota bacterium]|nr:LamG domain-containing protein [Cyanobacteriota bacterium]